MGDPGGIGPEVTLKALMRADVREQLDAIIIGDVEVLQKTAKRLRMAVPLKVVDAIGSPAGKDSLVVSVFQPDPNRGDFSDAGVGAENGKMSHSYIVAAAQAVLAGHCDAMCTAPISKEALFAAGFTVPGHTELLAQLCKQNAVRMMLVGGGLRVVLQTIHVALKDVPGLVTTEAIAESLDMISDFAARVGFDSPKVAVCGLNPHAGEGGHFGTEEIDMIVPAVRTAASRGMQIAGPLPADTVYHQAMQGEFDFVLAMYHDQGLIPVKTLDFHGGVNVTLGLPLVRTSPDHGTAFALAGRGVADERSMVSALKYAAGLTLGQF